MLERLVTVGLVPAIFWAVALVHQLGHYYTGRRIVGIPGSDMRIVSPLAPRYVALRDDSVWVPPHEFERYRECYERHESNYENFERFVAGGELIQTLAVVPAAVALALSTFEWTATLLILSSILVTFLHVAVDAGRTWRTGTLSGDYSALWHVSRRVPLLLLTAFLFVHLSVFSLVV